METIHLLGSEDVQRAGVAMRSAAESMERGANWLRETLERHEQAMRELTAILVAALEAQKGEQR